MVTTHMKHGQCTNWLNLIFAKMANAHTALSTRKSKKWMTPKVEVRKVNAKHIVYGSLGTTRSCWMR